MGNCIINRVSTGLPLGGTQGQLLAKSSNDNYKVEWVDKPTVDQTYDATSQNAQSGLAVAEGVADAIEASTDQTYDATSTNAQSGTAVAGGLATKANLSHTHGNISNEGAITATATVASGDKIAIVDSSNSSKVTGGPQFGTNGTQYLANNGSWGTPTGTYSKTSFELLRDTSDTTFSSGEIVSASKGSPYNIIYVELYDGGEGGWRVVGSGLVFKGYSTQICNTWSNYYGLRTVTFKSNGQVTISAHTVDEPTSLVPRRVWGIK